MKYSRYSSYDSKQLQDIVSEIPRIHVPKKKVALCYWGIARSTDFTIESIERNIWKPLEDANIEYTTFVHTFSVNKPYTNSRASEWNIHLKNDIWKMLLPDHYIVENQEDIDKILDFKKYRSHGDPWEVEQVSMYQKYSTHDNLIRALYSLSKVTNLWKPMASTFDAVIYLRPDVRFISPLNVEWIHECRRGNIYAPNFHLVDDWNDRFAIGKPADMILYGSRFQDAYQYSLYKPLHSEGFLSEYMKKHKIKPTHIFFLFRRIRADNHICPADETIENSMKL